MCTLYFKFFTKFVARKKYYIYYMANLRFSALKKLEERVPKNEVYPRPVDIFQEDVFTISKMQGYMSSCDYAKLITILDKGNPIDARLANIVAGAMKDWAIEKGATHYTHWFHPLNEATAEKHDAFIDFVEGGCIEKFGGSMLVQQEPDASSFPNGGIRNTFEARGYTAWDPGSPAFINNNTLCVPTIFIAYTGEALDYKTPLLKSISKIDEIAVKICKYFDDSIKKVHVTLGWEQEYFLIDESLYNARPDLKLCGRTLIGHSSAKEQQLEDHYFGAIPRRVNAFMDELEYVCYKLGIPVKTRHNEVAPNQFELAPMFEEANLAVDHNQLLMSTMKKVARNHKFRVLLHEKPYKGVNGSGKHNNWSLLTDTGVNLLSPGSNPRSNMQFLIFLVSTIRAVYEHEALLKASIVSLGNEYRLGGDEAPPVIMSVFLGKYLSNILEEIQESVLDDNMTEEQHNEININIGKIPEIIKDNTDRNRTSPFAFTGNRFEFRAVGSSANCSSAMISLNTAVADQLNLFYNTVESYLGKGMKRDESILAVLKKFISESKPILFEGNGYGDEWKKEAEKRGLSTVEGCINSLEAFVSDKSKKLFIENGIYTDRELEARYEIKHEIYVKKLQIESRLLGDIAINHIIPTAIAYQNTVIQNVKGLRDILPDLYGEMVDVQLESIKKISNHIKEIRLGVMNMIEARKLANKIEDVIERAGIYSETVRPFMESIRIHIDKLEIMVDDEIWPLPKYRELLFSR